MKYILIFSIFIISLISANDDRALYIKKYANESKTALIIGNSNYNHFSKLKNSKNDARDMEKILKAQGFNTIYVENASLRDMKKIARKFTKKLRDGGVGFFYYAGHGVEVDGKNYLIPVNAEIPDKTEVEYEAFPVNLIVDKMEDSNNRLNIVVLDACRNDPFSRGGGGLAQINNAKGMYIAYATAPGEVASDGSDKNGLFTKHLIKNIALPNLTLNQVFKNTREDVFNESEDKQLPWTSSSVIGDFYFNTNSSSIKPKTKKANDTKQNSTFSFNSTVSLNHTLTINTTPSNAIVQITNIKQKYHDGISLKNGKYTIKVSEAGYYSKTGNIELKSDLKIDIALEKKQKNKILKTFSNDNLKCKTAEKCVEIGRKYYDSKNYVLSEKYHLKACSLGDAKSCSHLGYQYRTGKKYPKNKELSLKYYSKYLKQYQDDCNSDNSKGCYELGNIYSYGRSVKRNTKLSLEYYKKGCELGYAKSCNRVGDVYKRGRGIAKDNILAMEYYKTGCELKDGSSCNKVAYEYRRGKIVEKNNELAIKFFKKSCDELDYAGSCSSLGLYYKQGKIVDMDKTLAMQYYKKGCKLKSGYACNRVGLEYGNGNIIEKDNELAVIFYQKACDLDLGIGCSNLAFKYFKGEGIPKNTNTAIKFYKKACDELDSSTACNNLSFYIYNEKDSLKNDYQKANKYYKKACDMGNNSGCINLGYNYQYAKGFSQDYGKAFTLYKKACNGGRGGGCSFLAYLYKDGNGISKDTGLALKYFKKGCDNGHKGSCTDYKDLKKSQDKTNTSKQ